MGPILNIAGYHFVALQDLKGWATRIRTLCEKQHLLGFVVIAPEGLNFSLAGDPDEVEAFYQELRTHACFSRFEIKRSFSRERPFERLWVKIKEQIIPFEEPVSPTSQRAPTISAEALHEEIRTNSDLQILDVRNQCETSVGRFRNSAVLPLKNFRSFPSVLRSIPELEDLKSRPVVTVCTGGIKTEKATLWMLQNGFTNVRQLEGGILRYFEAFGEDDFEGRCFVFDHRGSLDGNLQEPDSTTSSLP